MKRCFGRLSKSGRVSPKDQLIGQTILTKLTHEERTANYYANFDFNVKEHNYDSKLVNGNELHFFRGDLLSERQSQALVEYYQKIKVALAIDTTNSLMSYQSQSLKFR